MTTLSRGRNADAEYVQPDGYVKELFFSPQDIEKTRNKLMQEALAAGFFGDKRSHPHWRYIRQVLFEDDPETLQNTERNSLASSVSEGTHEVNESPSCSDIDEKEEDLESAIAMFRSRSRIRERKLRRRSGCDRLSSRNGSVGSCDDSYRRGHAVRFMVDGACISPGGGEQDYREFHEESATPSPPHKDFRFSDAFSG